jgi:hypothetical protein
MHGFLIYTASGDSAGTMGRLVRQGKPGRLKTTLRRALKHAAWCSSNPVCIGNKSPGLITPTSSPFMGVVFFPETLCEEDNRLLDRAPLIDTPETPAFGFFSNLP